MAKEKTRGRSSQWECSYPRGPLSPPQPWALPHLAEPVGQPYLLHGHVIRENFIVKKELHLGRR